jgi:hypothetical protein
LKLFFEGHGFNPLTFFSLDLDFDFDLEVCMLYRTKSFVLLLRFLLLVSILMEFLVTFDVFLSSSKADVSIFLAVKRPLEFKVCLLFALFELVYFKTPLSVDGSKGLELNLPNNS